MIKRAAWIAKRIKEGRLKEMGAQTKWIYGYAKRYWPAMICYTLLGMTGTVVSLASSLVSKDLVDIITGHETGLLMRTFCAMIGLGVGSAVVSQLSNFAATWISLKVDNEIKAEIFEKILLTDWQSLSEYHTGDLLTRWGTDASKISSGVLSFIPDAIIYICRFIGAFAVVIYYDWTFALLAFCGMPVSLLLSKTLMRRMVRNNKRSAAMNAKMSSFNQEAFSNIQTIKAFDLIRRYGQQLKELQKEYLSMRMDFQKMSIGTSLLLTTVGLIVSYLSYGWGIYRVWSGAISYGTMTMFLGLSGTLTGTLSNLTSLVPTAINLTTSAGRLMDIVEMPCEDYSEGDEAEKFLAENRAEGIGLSLSDISYSYKNGNEVFCGAALAAYPHEIVALVGPSGEGKTTMLRMLLALAPVSAGSAKVIASKSAEEMTISPSTRRFFSYVPQGNTLFSGTIAENMRNVKAEATDEEIIEVLKLACAWEFVERLPEGINSLVKERGGGFSEGQAQRLSIARALLRRAPILLLDEATSALDVAIERRVLRNIMQDDYPRTCIVTTHRPTVLHMCSRVYAIKEKRCAVLNDEEIERLVQEF